MAQGNMPVLVGDAAAAVAHRGSHVQIVAAAGSGKTEVVAQRVAALLADGVPASGIVAFTFTERAAASLKERIVARAAHQLGPGVLDTIGQLFVGTIHAYCFRLLQQHTPQFESYDVLDPNKLTAFITRHASRMDLRRLDDRGRLFASARALLQSTDVIENELLDVSALPDPLRDVCIRFYGLLDDYRLLTYGRQISHAVNAMQDSTIAARVHADLRHLIVDEYQDVNPAQERLIALMAGAGAELTVVGDDDQAIYQWRGSDVDNILTFTARYPDAAVFRLETNYRSRPAIIEAANSFASSIVGRQVKEMRPHRDGVGDEVVCWHAETEAEEADRIAAAIVGLHADGLRYRDIAVLVRGRAAYPKLLAALESHGVPVQPAGRTGLFERPEAIVLGQTYAWLVGVDWRRGYGNGERVEFDQLLADYCSVFNLTQPQAARVRARVLRWQAEMLEGTRSIDLVRNFYDLLADLDCRSWDQADPMVVNSLGTLARFTTLLADYEAIRRRARPDAENPGSQIGGQDRGEWYVRNLALHVTNYASGAFEGFDGEPEVDLDAVDLTTVHTAKGLEWPVVFVPSVTGKRFPSSMSGREQNWLVPRHLFDAARYEGCDADERRLFYVAMTRARDWLSLSAHAKVTKQRVGPSPYLVEVQGLRPDDDLSPPTLTSSADVESDAPLALTFSELAAFDDCGMSYRLRNLLGFEPPLAPELGYGRAVHHVLRTIAERTRTTRSLPDAADVRTILDQEFFLPTANKAAFRQMRLAAEALVNRYLTTHADDLFRVWETERPFELHLDGMIISGRADVILDGEGDAAGLAIVDYKTASSVQGDHDLQLQIYAEAGRREGLDVRAAYVHDLKSSERSSVDVSPTGAGESSAKVAAILGRFKQRDYSAQPGTRCSRCDVRPLCSDGNRSTGARTARSSE